MTTLEQASTPNPNGFREIDVQRLAASRGTARLIDVREPSEYNAELGHIAGTELVPLATVEHVAKAWDRTQEIVVVCRSGGRSGRAAAALAAMGFKHIINMAGGMLAWNAAGLPVER
ncbi:MAG: rhodanese-like domain-containing protein [Deltaproteobacteria bacterium]|nr:rhodanese-like domain-containing protein [Deltaproteobacteria bacterium]